MLLGLMAPLLLDPTSKAIPDFSLRAALAPVLLGNLYEAELGVVHLMDWWAGLGERLREE